MKKQILAPLCSALVIPGLGQILNQEIKKGLVILVLVLVLVGAGVVKLASMVSALFAESASASFSAAGLVERLRTESLSDLYALLIAFALVWAYSVADAFWGARKAALKDKAEGS